MITLDARLAYRSKHDPEDVWKPYAASTVERILDCSIDKVKVIYNINLFFACVFPYVHMQM